MSRKKSCASSGERKPKLSTRSSGDSSRHASCSSSELTVAASMGFPPRRLPGLTGGQGVRYRRDSRDNRDHRDSKDRAFPVPAVPEVPFFLATQQPLCCNSVAMTREQYEEQKR